MNTRTRILGIASDLLQRQSMNGFSLQNVADHIGIRKASLFHHYRNKDALVADVLSASIDALRQLINEVARLSAQRQLDAFFGVYLNSIGAGRRLCPVGGVLGDWDHLDESVQQQARILLDVQESWLASIALKGGYAQDEAAAQAWAEQTLQSIQGGLLTSRVRSSPLPLERAVARIKASLATATD